MDVSFVVRLALQPWLLKLCIVGSVLSKFKNTIFTLILAFLDI